MEVLSTPSACHQVDAFERIIIEGMFEPVGGGEMPGPVPGPGWDPDGGLAGPPGAGLDAVGGFTAGGGFDPDGAGWDGSLGWLTAMDLAGADDPPVEHELWPAGDAGPWPDLESGRWPDEAAGPEGDPTPWSGGDARVGWPVFGEVPPSAQVAALLTSVGVGELDEFDLVEAVAAWERIGAWAAAHQVKALADLVSRPMFARLSSLRDLRLGPGGRPAYRPRAGPGPRPSRDPGRAGTGPGRLLAGQDRRRRARRARPPGHGRPGRG